MLRIRSSRPSPKHLIQGSTPLADGDSSVATLAHALSGLENRSARQRALAITAAAGSDPMAALKTIAEKTRTPFGEIDGRQPVSLEDLAGTVGPNGQRGGTVLKSLMRTGGYFCIRDVDQLPPETQAQVLWLSERLAACTPRRGQRLDRLPDWNRDADGENIRALSQALADVEVSPHFRLVLTETEARFIERTVFSSRDVPKVRLSAEPTTQLDKIKGELRDEYLRLLDQDPSSRVKQPTPAVRAAIRELIELMTPEEKIGQMVQASPEIGSGPSIGNRPASYEELLSTGRLGHVARVWSSEQNNHAQELALNSRLGIPILSGGDAAPHGFWTMFPVPIGLAATFAPELSERTAEAAAREAYAAGVSIDYSPSLDMSGDPRWGRVVESTGGGEDVLLTTRMGCAHIVGKQRHTGTIAKHFVAYGGARAGRDYAGVDISDRQLYETYLPPFKAAVDAGATAMMCGFHALNGVPMTMYRGVLVDVLREHLNADDLPLFSDYGAILELIQHGVIEQGKEEHAVEAALRATIDVDLQSFAYLNNLPEPLASGRFPADLVDLIDRAVERVLLLKWKVGLFAFPLREPDLETKMQLTAEHRALAFEAAAKSIVMLKNASGTPPLEGARRIAVIGALADSAENVLGPAVIRSMGQPGEAVSLRAGIEARADKAGAEVVYAPGPGAWPVKEIDFEQRSIAHAVETAHDADVIVAVVGEDSEMSGEAASRSTIDLPGSQQKLLEALKAEATANNKRLVVVLVNGRPLAVPWIDENADDVFEAWYLGTEAGHAVAAALWGDTNPSGKLPVTFPRSLGQVPITYGEPFTGRPAEHPRADGKFSSRYIDEANGPLWPFGHGLSYGMKNEFGPITVDTSQFGARKVVTVRLDVTNHGTRAAEDVVQLYLREAVTSVARRAWQLKDFRRVAFEPSETKSIEFELAYSDLKLLDQALHEVFEPGEFIVRIGPNSVEGSEARFRITADMLPAANS